MPQLASFSRSDIDVFKRPIGRSSGKQWKVQARNGIPRGDGLGTNDWLAIVHRMPDKRFSKVSKGRRIGGDALVRIQADFGESFD